jgi:hypothetical protein
MQTCFLLRPASASFSSFWLSAPQGKITRDGIFKLLRSPGIDSKEESFPPVYVARAVFLNVYGAQESIPRLLTKFTNTGSGGPVRQPYSYSVSSPNKLI